MRDKLFFHERADENIAVLDHTYCVEYKDDCFYVGYAVAHNGDMFCKKTGRELAEKKVHALTSIPHVAYRKDDDKTMLPHSIACTLDKVVDKAMDILKLKNLVEVKTFASVHGKRIPVALYPF